MLTDAKVRNARAADKPQKLADGQGMHLFISPAGAKVWRLRYEIGGKERTVSLGTYPGMTLAQAREARDAAKVLVQRGLDPVQAKRTAKAAAPGRTFEVIGRAWHKQMLPQWTARHADDVITSLEPIFKAIGHLDISAITPQAVLAELRQIEERPAIETAKRVRQRMSAIFVHGIASGLCEQDPASVVTAALKPLIKGRQPAITDLVEAREIIRSVESHPAFPVTKLALRLLALTAVRPGELRAARWDEIDGDLWSIPAERMKMRRSHVVPLSRQALDVLEALRPFAPKELLFPMVNRINRPISENAIGYLLNRAGYHSRHVPHGWRATFSSVMNERFPADRAVIDLMLAHLPTDRTEAAYNRAEHFGKRRELAQAWADLIAAEWTPAETVGLGRKRSA